MYKVSLYFCLLICSFSCFSQKDRPHFNMHAFAKLYGYVRYFHPSDEAAIIDWDRFAIYRSAQLLHAKNDTELLAKLQELFAPLAPSLQLYSASTKKRFDARSITPPDTRDYEIIAWQHYGYGQPNAKSVYKSVRINRPVVSAPIEPTFAPVSKALKADDYAGKKMKVKAWMKVIREGTEGKGQLWLRVDKEKGMGMLVKNHDGSEHHLKGIIPDIFVERTLKGVAEERDEFLEKAIEIAEK